MKLQIEKFEMYLDTLSKRDQIALFVIIFVVVIAAWSNMIQAPLSENMITVEHDIKQKNTELATLQSKMQVLQKLMTEDPDLENRQQLARYVEENERLDIALEKTSVEIINPQEMTDLLEKMLKAQTGLKFVSLKNKPAMPEFVETRDEEAPNIDNVNTIYRHSVVLQMEGSYHSALAYLKKLEQFPWGFFWQRVDIETSKYPNAVITLEVYTLGFREGLVGV